LNRCESNQEIRELLLNYKTQTKDFKKILMGLSVAANMSYEDIVSMSHDEREILAEVLTEKAEAQNPKKQSQRQLQAGPQIESR
jgi:hypothetical protein